MARGWTWQNEETEHSETETATLDALAAEWSEIHDAIEAEGFRRQAAVDDGDDPADHFDTEEDFKEWQRGDRVRQQRQQVRLNIVEAMLSQLGARMMRPYEHWNEDEAYMQYMECGRFGHSAY